MLDHPPSAERLKEKKKSKNIVLKSKLREKLNRMSLNVEQELVHLVLHTQIYFSAPHCTSLSRNCRKQPSEMQTRVRLPGPTGSEVDGGRKRALCGPLGSGGWECRAGKRAASS